MIQIRVIIVHETQVKDELFFQDIPKSAILKYFIRCSICDFVTKVRLNLIKHLKLHLKEKDVKKFVPVLTPINQPEAEDGSLGFAKMQSLLVIISNVPFTPFFYLHFGQFNKMYLAKNVSTTCKRFQTILNLLIGYHATAQS